MNDCPNAEMRDLLPDLLHDRLTATVRAEVTAHVADCVDCREELELIRNLQMIVTARAPRVDVSYVVGALPKPPRRDVTPIATRRRSWADWRIAAAVTLLVAGGSSVALLNRAPASLTDSVVSTTPIVADASIGMQKAAVPSASSAEPAEIGAGGRLADLDDAQLEALIDEIEEMKAVPITEPEPVALRVEARNTSGAEEL